MNSFDIAVHWTVDVNNTLLFNLVFELLISWQKFINRCTFRVLLSAVLNSSYPKQLKSPDWVLYVSFNCILFVNIYFVILIAQDPYWIKVAGW